jgi:hypothetical protein
MFNRSADAAKCGAAIIHDMADTPGRLKINEAQRLALLREMLLEVSSAVQDLRDDVLRLYEKSRQALANPLEASSGKRV